MAITPRPKLDPKIPDVVPPKVAEFEEGAPDSKPKKAFMKGNRIQISHTISPEMLGQLDAMAKKTGTPRASLINLAIYRALEHWLEKE
jgi:hypothetical protein